VAKDRRASRLPLFALSACVMLACAALAACAASSRPVARAQEPAGEGGASGAPEAAGTAAPAPSNEPPPLTAEEEAINRRPLRLPLAEPQVLVEKRARRVTLYSKGERVRVYRAVLGFAPVGDKERQGDGRTPEGIFYVCVKNEKSNFYLSLGLSYPNEEDAERGRGAGLITPAQAARIRRAIRRRATPPWDTALGGEIFIHGGGISSDWTAGCVALENQQMKELFDAVPIGTAVRIVP
jgi:lipoprotein-anchoring transpeptidase ErfK/SrfK